MNKLLQNIASVGPAYKIQAIETYMHDFSSFDIAKVESKLQLLNSGLSKEQISELAIQEMQKILWAEFRSELSRDNYYWSCVCMKHNMKNKTPKFHIEAYEALNDRSKRYKCFVRFRGSAKTAQKTNDILYNACEAIEPVMILVSSAAGLAQNDLIEVKAEVESNDVIKYIYGKLTGQKHWNNRFLEMANGVAIMAKGTTSQIRGTKWKGQRPTKIYLDDFEDEKNADTQEKRDGLKKWFSSQISPIGDVDMQIVLFGTIVHPDAFLANANPENNKDSIFGKSNGFFSRVDIADKDGNPIWEDRYNKSWIADKYDEHKSNNSLAFYYQEYFNIPAQESNPVIDAKMIHSINARFCETYGVTYLEVFDDDDLFQMNAKNKVPINTFIGVDPTRATNAMSDDFVMTAIGVTPSNNYVILDQFAEIVKIKDQFQRVVDFINIYKPVHTTIETYGYQLGLLETVDQVSIDNGYNYVLFPFAENKSKKAKYKEGLTHPISTGKVGRLAKCPNWNKFEIQAGKFSGGEVEHDDLLDGLFLGMHEDKDAGKILWGPYITDVDLAIQKAKSLIDKKKSKKHKNFMAR